MTSMRLFKCEDIEVIEGVNWQKRGRGNVTVARKSLIGYYKTIKSNSTMNLTKLYRREDIEVMDDVN